MIPPLLEREARSFARGEPVAMEARLAQLSAAAIARGRIDEAIFWQRVTVRSRLIRAIGGRDIPAGPRYDAEEDRRAC